MDAVASRVAAVEASPVASEKAHWAVAAEVRTPLGTHGSARAEKPIPQVLDQRRHNPAAEQEAKPQPAAPSNSFTKLFGRIQYALLPIRIQWRSPYEE